MLCRVPKCVNVVRSENFLAILYIELRHDERLKSSHFSGSQILDRLSKFVVADLLGHSLNASSPVLIGRLFRTQMCPKNILRERLQFLAVFGLQ